MHIFFDQLNFRLFEPVLNQLSIELIAANGKTTNTDNVLAELAKFNEAVALFRRDVSVFSAITL